MASTMKSTVKLNSASIVAIRRLAATAQDRLKSRRAYDLVYGVDSSTSGPSSVLSGVTVQKPRDTTFMVSGKSSCLSSDTSWERRRLTTMGTR